MANYMIDLRGIGSAIQRLEDGRYRGRIEDLQPIILFAIAERLETIASALENLAKEAEQKAEDEP